MDRTLCFALLALALGCSGSFTRPQPAPALAGSARRARCWIQGASLRCPSGDRALAELNLALPLRALAPRALGGLWLLDAERTLLRVDARGRATGRASDAGDALLASAPFVCTWDVRAGLSCRVDHHDDSGCGAETPLLPAIALDPGFAAERALPGGVLCGAAAEGAQRCARLTRPCGLGCLRFPACSAELQCIAGCSPDQPGIAAQLLDPTQFDAPASSSVPLVVTHGHGRRAGGYAAGRARE